MGDAVSGGRIEDVEKSRRAFDATGKVFNASVCGDNCAKWILKISREKDLTINLRHIMEFPEEEFQAEILNNGVIVRDMNTFVDIAAEYV